MDLIEKYLGEARMTKAELKAGKQQRVEHAFMLSKKGKKIAINTLNPFAGEYYVEHEGTAWWIKRDLAINQGPVKDFIKKVKTGKLRFIELV